MGSPALREKIEEPFGGRVQDGGVPDGMQTFLVEPDLIVVVCRFLKEDPELRFDFLADLCGVDHYPEENRFEVVDPAHVREKIEAEFRILLEEAANLDDEVRLDQEANLHSPASMHVTVGTHVPKRNDF